MEIFHNILSVPQNNVMDLKDIMDLALCEKVYSDGY